MKPATQKNFRLDPHLDLALAEYTLRLRLSGARGVSGGMVLEAALLAFLLDVAPDSKSTAAYMKQADEHTSAVKRLAGAT